MAIFVPVAAKLLEAAVVCPRTTELNRDKKVFRSYREMAKYFAMYERDLTHLRDVHILQNIPLYRVGSSVSCTDTEILPVGVLRLLYWVDTSHLFPVSPHCNDGVDVVSAAENENEDNIETVSL